MVGTFPVFLLNLFEKGQVAACRYSKEFRANPRNVWTNRKKIIGLIAYSKYLYEVIRF
jgi:hypothetical protein